MAERKLSVKAVETAKPGRHGDGGGLWLCVSPTGAKRWTYRFMIDGKASEISLGAYPSLSLSQARAKADETRALHKSGTNPVEAKRAAQAESEGRLTFSKAAERYIGLNKASWRNEKHAAQWEMTLKVYCASLSQMPVDEIKTAHVLACLKPIWQEKPETAARVRGRIEAVLDAARALGAIEEGVANPARWKGHLDKLLPARHKLSRGHHASLPYEQLPEFISALREREAVAALALEFTILTAARTGETIGALWSEIDLTKNIWAIPAERMKAAKAHTIPLSARAVEILTRLKEVKTGPHVFTNINGRSISSGAMEALLRRMDRKDDVTVHGFRASFRQWAGQKTGYPRELIEEALAHVWAGDVEAAYWRGASMVERRRELMDAWASYIEPTKASNIIHLRG
jgi:integrase